MKMKKSHCHFLITEVNWKEKIKISKTEKIVMRKVTKKVLMRG